MAKRTVRNINIHTDEGVKRYTLFFQQNKGYTRISKPEFEAKIRNTDDFNELKGVIFDIAYANFAFARCDKQTVYTRDNILEFLGSPAFTEFVSRMANQGKEAAERFLGSIYR